MAADLRKRVVISGVQPELDSGRFAIKRTVGESVVVEVDVFADGHDEIAGVLLYRKDDSAAWGEVRLQPLGNDRWRAVFPVTELGRYVYTIEAWIDLFSTWLHDLRKRIAAGQDVAVDLAIGAGLLEDAAGRASDVDARKLLEAAQLLREGNESLVDDGLAGLARQYPDRRLASRHPRELAVVVDRARARFGAWYEFFPRSCGTLRQAEARLDYVASMGFDIVYLPPIHPIGQTYRKGRNNAEHASPGDVGSPWAIGSAAGGHAAIHPDLGSMEDFEHFVAAASARSLEVAIDIAFQCSPDHPYVNEHPEWFRRRPDGSIQYAENPPKKYQDIYPINFESEDWPPLWRELTDVVRFWIAKGIRIFRVDNPHTKAFPFWEALILDVKRDFPDCIFLSEAFTRPKVMYRLSMLGFTQSYTYFTWRNTKQELIAYFTELSQTGLREFFRPNLWPNTPDILPEALQFGGRPAFLTRLVLAATLGASYGIYGPAYELCENQAREPGSEEYLNSEKYEIKNWDVDRPDSLREIIRKLNDARHSNPALQSDWNLRFHDFSNDMVLCYSKHTEDLSNAVVVIVNLDPRNAHGGWVTLDTAALGIAGQTYQMYDLLTGTHQLWSGPRNYVELNPAISPALVFQVRRKVRTERDFDYFL